MFEDLARLHAELDSLAVEQMNGTKPLPWWADGHYDAAEAAVRHARGREARQTGDVVGALTAFTEAVSLAPDRLPYVLDRIQSAMACQRPDIALREIQRVLTCLDATCAQAHRCHVGVFMAYREWGRALVALVR